MTYYFVQNRTLCGVLEEMRNCLKTNNFSYLGSLIEEAQSMGNRMEAGLHDKKDVKDFEIYKSRLKKEIRNLEQEKRDLEDDKPEHTS